MIINIMLKELDQFYLVLELDQKDRSYEEYEARFYDKNGQKQN